MKKFNIIMGFDDFRKKEFYLTNDAYTNFNISSVKTDLIKYLILADYQLVKENVEISMLSNENLKIIVSIIDIIIKFPDFKKVLKKLNISLDYTSVDYITDIEKIYKFDINKNFSDSEIKSIKNLFNSFSTDLILNIILNLSDIYCNEISYVNSLDFTNKLTLVDYLINIESRPIATDSITFFNYRYLLYGIDTKYKCYLYLLCDSFSNIKCMFPLSFSKPSISEYKKHYSKIENIEYLSIGTALIDILNNSDTIIQTFYDSIYSIQKITRTYHTDKNIDLFVTDTFRIFENIIQKLNKITPYLLFTQYYDIISFKDNWKEKLIISNEKFIEEVKDFSDFMITLVNKLSYYTKLFSLFIEKEGTYNLNLPIANINYKIKPNQTFNKESYFEYKFLITNIDDFFNVSLYLIIKENLNIIQCKNCNKYFISHNKRDDIYCSNPSPQDNNYTCSELVKLKKHSTDEMLKIKSLYTNACNRLYTPISRAKKKSDIKLVKKLEQELYDFKIEYKKKEEKFLNKKLDFKTFTEWLNNVNKQK